jgi:uncharacterized protein YndB with AHSA1/START domain
VPDATETQAIRIDRYYECSPAVLWRALTTPELVALWWAPGDIKPEVGRAFEMDMGSWGVQRCEVIEADPEHRFAYRYAIGVLDSTITWTIDPDGTGTWLHLDHTGFDLNNPMHKMAYEGMSNGWAGVLQAIDRVTVR